MNSDKAFEICPVINFKFIYTKSFFPFYLYFAQLHKWSNFLQIEFPIELLYKTRMWVALEIEVALEEFFIVVNCSD